MSPCKYRPLILPTLLDQLYYVTNPLGSYDAPPFTSEPECPQDITHTNTVSANTWINNFLGVGKLVEWQTNEELHVGQYTVTIFAENMCQNGSGSYILDVQSQCKV